MDQSLIFMKVLSKTDVEHRMAIPMESFAVFVPGSPGASGVPKGQTIPTPNHSSHQIGLSKEKCLKEGDRVSFFHVKKDGEERLQFGVQALKKSRLLGTDFWTPV
ncbi:hypothetical protein OIU76_018726 [Salix suchowensis]|nr:hypothetical protein OIU76_018726 [Salix suchowensis]